MNSQESTITFEEVRKFLGMPTLMLEEHQNVLPKLIGVLEIDTTIQIKLECIQFIVLNVLPDVSVEDVNHSILRYLMPSVKDLVEKTLDNMCIILNGDDEQNAHFVSTWKKHLQISTNLLQALDSILDYILNLQEVQYYQISSVPLSLSSILFATINHFKTSDELYKKYVSVLSEILSLFKKTQNLYMKLLGVMDSHVIFNFDLQEQVISFAEFINIVGDIGAELAGMNVKAMVDSWKNYINLAQKYEVVLNQYGIDINNQLQFFSAETNKNLQSVLLTDMDDIKSVTQTLKVSNFLIKVAVKVCNIFHSKLQHSLDSIVELCFKINKYCVPYLQFRKISENIIELFNVYIFDCSNSFIDIILCVPGFTEAFYRTSLKNTEENQWGKLYTTVHIFRMLPTLFISNPEALYTFQFYKFLDAILNIIAQSFISLPCDTSLVTQDYNRINLFEELVTNISATILLLNPEQYILVEQVLWKHLIHEKIWPALLVVDVWSLVLSNSSANVCFETICNIIDQTESLLSSHFTKTPEVICVGNLLQRTYQLLPNNYKIQVADKYFTCKTASVWKIMDLANLPKSHMFIIEPVLINLMDTCKLLKSEKCTILDFVLLCNGLEIVSTMHLNEMNINVDHFVRLLNNMWDFDAKNGDLLNNKLFIYFIVKLCVATSKFVCLFNNEQLFLCLSQLKIIAKIEFNVTIGICDTLNALSCKQMDSTLEQNKIFMMVSDIFKILLNDSNPVIKQYSLEVFYNFLKKTVHADIIHNTVGNSDNLENDVSNFIQRKGATTTPDQYENYYKIHGIYTFKHKCIERILPDTDEQKHKKIKFDVDEVYILINKIKGNVERLQFLTGNDKLSDSNVPDVVNVIKCLQDLL